MKIILGFKEFPKKHTCDGENISPKLEIRDVPQNAKSIALILDDLDAPFGIFTHWLIWDIKASNNVIIPENVPKDKTVNLKNFSAVQGKNSFRKIGYSGPCPLPGKPHRYRFIAYALSDFVNLPGGSNRKQLEKRLDEIIIDRAESIATYSKTFISFLFSIKNMFK